MISSSCFIIAGGVDAEITASICFSTNSFISCCFLGISLFHLCTSHDFIRLPYAIPMMQGNRKSTAKSESMMIHVVQSICLSGVNIKASNSEIKNHEAVRTERSLENHLSMMMLYKRKSSAIRPIHPIVERVKNTNPAVVASIRKAMTATMLNAVAATIVSGNSIVRKLSDNRFITFRVSL